MSTLLTELHPQPVLVVLDDHVRPLGEELLPWVSLYQRGDLGEFSLRGL